MKLCHTSLDELTDYYEDNYGGNTPEVVSEEDPLVLTTTADEWFDIPGFQPFSYDGVDNLLIEVL